MPRSLFVHAGPFLTEFLSQLFHDILIGIWILVGFCCVLVRVASLHTRSVAVGVSGSRIFWYWRNLSNYTVVTGLVRDFFGNFSSGFLEWDLNMCGFRLSFGGFVGFAAYAIDGGRC